MLPFSLPFARPEHLYFLVLLPAFSVLSIFASRKRKRALERFGRLEPLAGMSSLRPGIRRRARLLLFAGLAALIVAAAGPRWGKGGETGVVVGRDLVVVLDLSRSMTANDMADPRFQQRWQAARAGVDALLAKVQERGGHRLGLVVFAAKPWMVCPLTSDYDHVRARLEEFTPITPPVEIRPEPDEPITSGTGIGAAIRMALAAHDPRFPGYQDILLISDGDGPGVEIESEGGIKEAADRQVPVYTVGLGSPTQPTELAFGEGEGVEFVGTKLQEGVLRNIARLTRGEYLAARQEVPSLGDWFATTIQPRPSRELSDDAIPQPRDRAAWFIALGVLMLLIAWMIEP